MSEKERIVEQINEMPEEDIIHMLRIWNSFRMVERRKHESQMAPRHGIRCGNTAGA